MALERRIDLLEGDGRRVGTHGADRLDIGGNARRADLHAVEVLGLLDRLVGQHLAEAVEGRADNAEAGFAGDGIEDFLADGPAPDAEEVVDVVIDIGHALDIGGRMERAEHADALIHAFEHVALHLLDHLVDGAQMRVREQLDRDAVAEALLQLLGEHLHRPGVGAGIGARAADAERDLRMGRAGHQQRQDRGGNQRLHVIPPVGWVCLCRECLTALPCRVHPARERSAHRPTYRPACRSRSRRW